MSFDVLQAIPETDFDELVQVEWASYEQPYCRLIRLFFPILGDDPEARAASLKESTERQLSWHKEDATSSWIKVVDHETGKIVGAACWHIYEKNPYSDPFEGECTWYPEGEGREMANSLMGQFLAPRMKYMAKPHVFLDICFVHPSYRRRGIGKLLVAWGLEKADEMGLETYIDATEAGIPVYEASGFVRAPRVDFDASRDEPSQQWRDLREELLPFSFWPMWRPVGGIHDEHKVKPWEQVA